MRWLIVWLLAIISAPAVAEPILLKPARLFDGFALHSGWQVLVDGDRIAAVGPSLAVPANARVVDLPDANLPMK